MRVEEIPTPSLLLDIRRFKANVSSKNERVNRLGVELRPHLKTCKSVDAARVILGADWKKAAVSTLTEALAFFDADVTDIRLTAPFAASKLPIIAPAIQRGLRFETLLCDVDNTALLARFAEQLEVDVHVMIELDSDGNRGGVRAGGPAFERLLDVIMSATRLKLAGLYSYAGGTYAIADEESRAALVERHRRTLVSTAEELRGRDIQVDALGIGSSPALESAKTLTGLTEACAGVFAFQDLAQAGVGVARKSAIAVTVLASVVQHKPDDGRIYIDAGGLALSQDRSTAKQETDQGYGLVCDAHTLEPVGNGDVIVAAVSQEHGLIRKRSGEAADPRQLPVGSRVRIMPNHVCMTANPYAGYHVMDGDEVVAWWPRANGWNGGADVFRPSVSQG